MVEEALHQRNTDGDISWNQNMVLWNEKPMDDEKYKIEDWLSKKGYKSSETHRHDKSISTDIYKSLKLKFMINLKEMLKKIEMRQPKKVV